MLVPTGSFGYRYGSKHHRDWTRQTIAHNLPLVAGRGQKLDDPSAIASVVDSRTESNYHVVTFDLSAAYAKPLERFLRTLVLIEDYGMVVVDSIRLAEPQPLNWRLHSPLEVTLSDNSVVLADPNQAINSYKCQLLNHADVRATLTRGYEDELSIAGTAIESDATKDLVHLDWNLVDSIEHTVVACCIRKSAALPEVVSTDSGVLVGLTVQGHTISVK